MSITNGQTVTSADLLAMNAAELTTLATLNLAAPTQYQFNLFFPNVITTTAARDRRADIVIPDDCFINDIAISTGNTNGSVTVTLDNGAMIEPITITQTGVDPAYTKFTRYYSVGSTATGKPVQVLLKGSILAVVVSNTDASVGPHVINIGIALDSRLRRF